MFKLYQNLKGFVVQSHFLFALLILVTMSCNQLVSSQEVPKSVKENFRKMYPGENDPDWHIDSHGYFEAKFKKNGIRYRADYFEDGRWFETETNIAKNELPKAIRKVIKERFGSFKISEIEKVEHHSKGLFYDVEFKRKGKNKDVEFKEDGTIIYITP